jgi:hypothetical protein
VNAKLQPAGLGLHVEDQATHEVVRLVEVVVDVVVVEVVVDVVVVFVVALVGPSATLLRCHVGTRGRQEVFCLRLK